MVNVYGPGMKGMVGMASRVFGAMSAADVSIVLITQSSSEYSISFCIEAQHKALAQQALADAFELELKDGLFEPVEFVDNVAIITLVGHGMRTSRGVASQFFLISGRSTRQRDCDCPRLFWACDFSGDPNDKISEAIKACHENLFNSKHF